MGVNVAGPRRQGEPQGAAILPGRWYAVTDDRPITSSATTAASSLPRMSSVRRDLGDTDPEAIAGRDQLAARDQFVAQSHVHRRLDIPIENHELAG